VQNRALGARPVRKNHGPRDRVRFLVRKFVHVDPLSVDFNVLGVARRRGDGRDQRAAQIAERPVFEHGELDLGRLKGVGAKHRVVVRVVLVRPQNARRTVVRRTEREGGAAFGALRSQPTGLRQGGRRRSGWMGRTPGGWRRGRRKRGRRMRRLWRGRASHAQAFEISDRVAVWIHEYQAELVRCGVDVAPTVRIPHR